jgi:SOS-response transcriptional repressor LexA
MSEAKTIDLAKILGVSKDTLIAPACIRDDEQPTFEFIRDGDLVLLDRKAVPRKGDVVVTNKDDRLVFEYYNPAKPTYAVAMFSITPIRK